MDDVAEVTVALANAIRVRMLTPDPETGLYFGRDSCVAACRLLIDALVRLGVDDVCAVPVFAVIQNREAVRLLARLDTPEGQRESADIWEELNSGDATTPGGPWSAGAGPPVDERGRVDATRPYFSDPGAGHVVVGIPSAGVMADPSIDQVSRPNKNIDIPTPLVFRGVDARWFVTPGYTHTWLSDDGLKFTYRRAKAHLYRTSPEWNRMNETSNGVPLPGIVDRTDWYASIVDDAIEQVRDR